LRAAFDALPGIDVVVVCTPTGLHGEVAIEALAAGAHVIVEKPAETTVARTDEIIAAQQRADRTVTVISQHRFDPSTERVLATIGSGGLGRVTSGIAAIDWWRSQDYYDSGDWRGTWALDGGGVLINQGVHTVDLLLWMMGRPDTVSAEVALLAHDGIEVEDTVVATIVFASGALGAVHATTAANGTLTSRLQVHGSAGSAVIEGDELVYASEGIVQHDAGSSHERQYLDLLAAIDEGRPPRVSAGEALWALATVRAVYLSATLGERIRVADVIAGAYDGVETRVPRR
jgi:predicted dehydrogenase